MKINNFFHNHPLLLAAVIVGIGDSSSAQFRDVSKEWGFSGGGKAAFGDFDGDGFVDLFAGKLWRNVDGKKFVEQKEGGALGERK